MLFRGVSDSECVSQLGHRQFHLDVCQEKKYVLRTTYLPTQKGNLVCAEGLAPFGPAFLLQKVLFWAARIIW